MSNEYRALVSKVEAFCDATFTRRRDDFACSAGCASCCHAWLSVSVVEADQVRAGLAALSPTERAEVRQRGARELVREEHGEQPRCAMLGDDDRCTIYEARPLVCRTQGHALRYPLGLIPSEAVSRRTQNADLTWCPLNYHASEPRPEDVLDAERVDQILAVVAARHADAHGEDREARFTLSALAAEGDVLHDESADAGLANGPARSRTSTPYRDDDE